MKPLCFPLAIFTLMAALDWPVFSAETKPAWQATWERSVAAAKKEGRLNLYVGRYGTEPLLNEFRKEFAEIKIVSVNGTGNSLGTRIITEMRANNVVADIFSGGANTNLGGALRRQGARFDQVRLDPARGARRE